MSGVGGAVEVRVGAGVSPAWRRWCQRRFHPRLTSELSLGGGLGVHPSGHRSGLQTSVGHVGGNRWAWTGTWGEDVQGLESSFGREFCRGSLGLELTSDVCFSSVTLAGSR